MNTRKDIEARLDRSLENQVRAPRLDRNFDAAVWARIAEEEAPTAVSARAAPPAVHGSRWLAISNTLGIAATLVVALYFASRALGGLEAPSLDLGLNVALPTVSDETLTRTITVLGQVLGYAAVAFGLSFTSLGRRIRRSFT